VREQINYLEQALIDDLNLQNEKTDAGWDSTSLRAEYAEAGPTGRSSS